MSYSPYKLHNEAVYCIQREEYEEATCLLKKAMKKVRLAISGDLRPGLYCHSSAEEDERPDEEASLVFSEDEGADHFCRFLLSSSVDDLPSSSSCFLNSSSGSVRSGRHTVFSSPILLTRGDTDLWDASSCEEFSYAAVYNLALTHHLMAIKTSGIPKRTSRKLLDVALSLYENAYNLLMNSPDMDVSVLHSLAIWSNLGHVLDALGEDEKSELCYQNLLSTIVYVVDNERERAGVAGNLNSMEKPETQIPIDGFFSNVMNLLLKNESVAPAA